MHQAIRAGNAEIAKAISPIDICSHRRCAPRSRPGAPAGGGDADKAREGVREVLQGVEAKLKRDVRGRAAAVTWLLAYLWLRFFAFATGSFGV